MRSVVKITKGVHLPQLYPSKSVRVMMEAFLSYNLVIMKITHKEYKFPVNLYPLIFMITKLYDKKASIMTLTDFDGNS
jgi:hypothetical protein